MPNNLIFKFPNNGDAKIAISLQKTIRVPDDGKDHPLPPSLGDFNYFTHGTKKIVPITDEEALWFNFSNYDYNLPVAIKILAGGINALTGDLEEKMQDRQTLKNNKPEAQSGQNYMVAPGQPWLDGFKGKDSDSVRQFVAVKMGQGKTVEEKLEGTQHGGLQIIVVPPGPALVEKAKQAKLEREAQRKAALEQWLSRNPGKTEKDYNNRPMPMACAAASAESAMGIGAGGKIKQQISVSHYQPSDFDMTKAKYVNLDLVHAMEFSLLNKLTLPPQIPTFDEWNNAGMPWFSLPANPGQSVQVDPHSRLAALDAAGNLSALQAEQPATQVKPSQVVALNNGLGMFQQSPLTNVPTAATAEKTHVVTAKLT